MLWYLCVESYPTTRMPHSSSHDHHCIDENVNVDYEHEDVYDNEYDDYDDDETWLLTNT